MKKYEYEIAAYKGNNLEGYLNHLGGHGWRLVLCDLDKNTLILERPIEQPGKEMYSYDTAQDGYVIYKNSKRVSPWDIVKALNND